MSTKLANLESISMTGEMAPYNDDGDGLYLPQFHRAPEAVWAREPIELLYGLDYRGVMPQGEQLISRWIYTPINFINSSEGHFSSRITAVRRGVTIFLKHQGNSEDSIAGIVLGISELVNNALRPRSTKDPNIYKPGWCQIWLGKSAIEMDSASFICLASTTPSGVGDEMRQALQYPDSIELANIDSEHGRGVFIASTLMREEGVAAQVVNVPIEDVGDTAQEYLAILLRVPGNNLPQIITAHN